MPCSLFPVAAATAAQLEQGNGLRNTHESSVEQDSALGRAARFNLHLFLGVELLVAFLCPISLVFLARFGCNVCPSAIRLDFWNAGFWSCCFVLWCVFVRVFR